MALPLAPGAPFVPTPVCPQAKASKARAMEVQQDVTKATAAVSIKAMAAKAKAREPKEEAKVPLLPQQPLTPAHLCLRQRLAAWKLVKASPLVLDTISTGVLSEWPCPTLPLIPTVRGTADLQRVQPIIQDYLQVGALREIPPTAEINFLIPWFVLSKKEPTGEIKNRLISDCRLLNVHLDPPQFRLENIQQVFPLLRKGMHAIKVDLKNAYFHLGVADVVKPYLCMQVGEKFYQWQEAPFGLSVLPFLFQSLMKTLLKRWRGKGLLVWVYLDDILLVNSRQKGLRQQAAFLLRDLEELGLQINHKKSPLTPTQQVPYLGFHLNLKKGTLEVPPQKLKTVRRELGKLITHSHLSPRKMAAILGTVRSFLTALPFLRAFTDQLCQFVKLQERWGWDSKQPLPPCLQSQLVEIRSLLETWPGR